MKRVLLAVALLLPGCGGSGPTTHKVSGTVKIKGGGPLGRGLVQLQSEKYSGSGGLSADGTYSISGLGIDSGVPEGTYKVVFLSTEAGGGYDNPHSKIVPIIDAKYTDRATTPLEVKVPGGTYDFELDPVGTSAPARK